MSDPVTNMAIEDVLSSIRRLVSEGDRPTKPDMFSQPSPITSAPPPAVAEQAPEIADKFVLTPALRIAEVIASGPLAGASARPPLAGYGLHGLPPLNFTKAPPQLVKPAPQPPESRSALEQRIAELEAAVTDQAGDWDPDGSEEVPVVDWSAAPAGDGFVFASRAMPQPDRSGVLDLGKVGTRIHPVIDDVAPGADPAQDFGAEDGYDLGEDLDLSGPKLGPQFAPDTGLEPGPDGDDVAAYLDAAGGIDEDALRQMVVDIVRQELQGPLGERITRNVRKMVRREIYRVLSSQEFES